MPFEVFRRHQRKLLAIFAILAMFGFVLADSLPALLRGSDPGSAGQDDVVVKLKGRTLKRSDIARMRFERSRANFFLAQLDPNAPQAFGGTSDREMLDAIILEAEADRLGMPKSAALANKWLRIRTNNLLTPRLFDEIYRRAFSEQVTDVELLQELANQIRIDQVRKLPGMPNVTPLEVFDAYRDQFERVSAFAVPFTVSEFLTQVPEPSSGEIEEFYNKYKDVEPDPKRETPGFKVPRRIRVEYVTLDGTPIAESYKAKLTEKELRAAFAERKDDFPGPPAEGSMSSSLPFAYFAGDKENKLTPHDPFPDVRETIATTLADEKTREEIDHKFDQLRDKVMTPFYEKYDEIAEANKEAAAEKKPLQAVPNPGDVVKPAALKLGLTYEKTPLVARDEAEALAPIGPSRVGNSPFGDGLDFAEQFFGAKASLYDPVELADDRGRRFLAWKLDDVAPFVPPLNEIKGEVITAWKQAQARPLAEKAANEFATKLRDAGGGDKVKQLADKRTLITTELTSRLQPGIFLPGTLQLSGPRPSELPALPDAGDDLRSALFGLEAKEVAVAPNAAKNTFYVLSLNQRIPAEFNQLYSPMGLSLAMRLRGEVQMEAVRRRLTDWMAGLRAQAGVPEGWVPPDEDKEKGSDGPR